MVKERIISLDGLRGIAALIVIMEHYLLAFFPFLMMDSVIFSEGITEPMKLTFTSFSLLLNGNSSVAVFFVLSGFALSYSSFNKNKRYGVNDFILKSLQRYVRLLLPVLSAVAFTFFVFLIDGYYFGLLVHFTQSVNSDYFLVAPNLIDALYLGFIGVLFEGDYSYNPALWTMRIELLGSLLVFALMFLCSRMPVMARMVLYFIVSVLFITTYYWAFVVGMALSDMYSNKERMAKIKNIKWLVWVTLPLSIYFLGFTLKGYDTNEMYGYIYEIFPMASLEGQIHVAGAFLLLLSILVSDKIAKLLSVSLFRFLGKISFSMYLIHYTVMASVSSYVFLWMAGSYSVVTSFIIACGIVGLPLTLLLSLFFTRIDGLSIKYSKKIKSLLTILKNQLSSCQIVRSN